jgi:hypothetical protein
MKLVRWAAGHVAVLFVLLSASEAWARAPEPGDEVQITLHDGNTVQGELLGLSESGYRVRFGGMEVIVAYPSVKAIDIVAEEALLEELRPGPGRDDPRGQTEPHYRQPEPSPSEPEPDSGYAPPPARSASPAAPRPRSAAPRQGAEALPSAAQENADASTEVEIPPKPRSRGGGLMTTGFVLLGVGVSTAVASSALYEEEGFPDDSTLPLEAVGGGIMASAGLALGITGIIMKSVSGARRRRWEREYGALDLESINIVPSLTAGGDGGLAIVGRF